MAFDDLDTTEMLYDVAGDRPHDAADTRLEDALPIVREGPPPHLSPSSASTYRSCAKRWRFRYVERRADPPGEAALAGTFAHHVLELLLQEPSAARSTDRAREIARAVWPLTEADPDFTTLGLDEAGERRFRWLAWTAIEGLWRLEDPAAVEVEATEQRIETTIAGVPFRGIVDRLDREHPQTGAEGGAGLIVVDYKSGRAPSRRFADARLDQVLLYAAAIEASTGQRPRMARLLYLGQAVIEAEVTDDNLGASVAGLQDTWQRIETSVATDEFPATPGPLCGWCPYAGDCAEGLAELELRNASGRIRSSAPSLRFLAATG